MQATLFDHPAPPTDPATSHEAARSTNRVVTVGEVRTILEQHPDGLTDDQLWLATGLPWKAHGSVVKRRGETGAVKVGRGLTLSERPCNIWALPGGGS